MNKVDVIVLNYKLNGVDFSINLTVISDEKEMVLIDCGMIESFEMIKYEMRKKGLDIYKLTKVIITHQDQDHIGGLKELKDNIPNIEIIASEEESKYIEGKEEFLRVKNINKIIDEVDNEKKIELENFKDRIKKIQNVKVDKKVKDGDYIDVGGGIEIVATPGHLPGHISVYLKESKTLVTGDALAVVNGILIPSNPQYTLDMEEALKSTKKLLNYDINKLICYHGGVFTENIRENIEKF